MIIASAIALASAFIPVFWLSLVFVLLITSVIPSDVLYFRIFYFLPPALKFFCFWLENFHAFGLKINVSFTLVV